MEDAHETKWCQCVNCDCAVSLYCTSIPAGCKCGGECSTEKYRTPDESSGAEDETGSGRGGASPPGERP